jgi:hypothetical protein
VSPYRTETDARFPPERLEALLEFIRHQHASLAFAGVDICSEIVGGGVRLIARRQGYDEHQAWFSADDTLKEVSSWCEAIETKFRARNETLGLQPK